MDRMYEEQKEQREIIGAHGIVNAYDKIRSKYATNKTAVKIIKGKLTLICPDESAGTLQ